MNAIAMIFELPTTTTTTTTMWLQNAQKSCKKLV
jgi:hypothetical protein